MNKTIVLLLISLILFSVPVIAEEFTVTVESVNDKINIDQEAEFILKITNNLDTAQDYRLTFGDVGLWGSYYTIPLSDYFSGINGVPAKQTYSTTILLKPIEDIGIGMHKVALYITEVKTNRQQKLSLPIYIKKIDGDDTGYLPHVTSTIELPKRIDPRNEENQLRVVLLNKNRRNLTSVEVIFESNLIQKTITTQIEPLGKKILEIPLDFDPLHPPEKDILYTTIKIDKYLFKPDPINFEIIDYSSGYLLERDEHKGFLLTTDKRQYINDGNVPRAEQLKIEVPLFNEIFMHSDPEPEQIIKQEGRRYWSWNVNLEAGEKFEIIVYTSYRIFFYLFMICILGYYGYLKFKAPITITKHAKNVEMRAGGVSEVKIMLNVKNNSNLPLENISVIDKVPNLADVTNDFGVGTLKPSKVYKHAHKGSTIVQWDIEELDANEDRLIVYNIKSRLSILGQFYLPLAMVKFRTKGGKMRKVQSNRLVIGKN